MTFPARQTRFGPNTLDPSWIERDMFLLKGEVVTDAEHHCKQTFLASLPYLRGTNNAVDIGCRDGEYTRYLQRQFPHVYAFDARMRKSFGHNVDVERVTHFVCALGDAAGEIEMYGGTHDPAINPIRSVVRCFTLDSFQLSNVDYMKIDVEGFERKVLAGAEYTIARWRPVIVIEQNDVRMAGEEPYAAKTWLEERGYRHVATCPRGWDHIMIPKEG
jgi:FkbM family methyltransferase